MLVTVSSYACIEGGCRWASCDYNQRHMFWPETYTYEMMFSSLFCLYLDAACICVRPSLVQEQ